MGLYLSGKSGTLFPRGDGGVIASRVAARCNGIFRFGLFVASPDVSSVESARSEQVGRSAHVRIITGTVIAGFCVFLQLYAPQPLLALFGRDFRASEAAVSLIISAAAFAVAVASPFVGMLADAVGRKRVIVPCLLALAFSTLGCAFSRTLDQLIFWRFIGGVCTPGVIAVTLAYISEEAAAHATGSVTALYVTGTVVGGLTGRLCAAFAADRLSWRWSFGLLAAMTLLGALAVWAFLPRSRRFTRNTQWRESLGSMSAHLRNPRLLATYLCGFTILFSHVGLFTYVNFHLARPPYSLSTSALGMVFLVYALGVVVTPLSGRLIDRLGHRAGIAVAVALIVAGAALTLARPLPVLVIGLAIASSGVFVAQASASSHIGRVAHGARSAAAGLYVACYYLGGAAGATGLAAPWRFGQWPAVVAAIVLVQCITLAITWRFFSAGPAAESSAAIPLE
jgi:predicted MFS family arabinose efflux permease